MKTMEDLLQQGLLCAALSLCFGVAAGADADGDMVEDAVDNCLLVANADQRDTDGDGYGNICDPDFNNDLVVNFLDVGDFKSNYLGDSPDHDLDGDGFTNFFDLGIVKSFFLKPPGPAGEDAVPGPDDGHVAVDAVLVAEPVCERERTHILSVDWQVLAPQSGETYLTTITAIQPDGLSDSERSEKKSGTAIFDLDSEYGGTAIVLTETTASSGESVLDTRTIPLPPCTNPPIPVPPDLGFVPAPVNDPPIIGVPDGKPREVDIVHLGGSPNGPTQPKVIAAVGTGAGFKLLSYGIDQVTHDPFPLTEAGPYAGVDVQLQVMAPEITPKLAVEPFVQGIRRDDGNLWLSTWQAFDDGSMKKFDTVGYGENAQAVIEAYAIAHRVLDGGDYQVVTPVRTQRGNLRTITWWIDHSNGDLTGVADSGPWGNPAADAQPTIRHLEDDLYVVSYRDANGRLAQRYWSVSNSGTPSDAGGGTAGLTHFGTGTATANIQAVIDLPITSRGFVTPIVTDSDDFEIHTWETRYFGFDEGAVYMPYQIADNTLDQDPNGFGIDIAQPTPTNATDGGGAFLQNVRALLTDGFVETSLGFGVGDGELFRQMPLFELTSVQIASVTKNMTLLIAVEAILDGEIALNDVIEVSQGAADVGGSQMGLEEGELQTLETLLHGLMLVSGNDAAAAIAEHISGNNATFAARMNLRASQLGMNDTTYGTTSPIEGVAAGSGLSTPQDQVTLWLHAKELDLFAEIAGVKSYDECGEDAMGEEKCYFINKFGDSGYPGLEGWKGGNGGFYIPGYSDNGGPYCVGSGCLAAQATRLDRDMVVALQSSGDRWGDADEMFAYGYRMQFTPDRRGAFYGVGIMDDFAMDGVLDTLGVTASINDIGVLKVCSYALFADSGSIDLNGCDEPRFTGVAGGVDRLSPTRLDGARISTLLADGDFWTGHTANNGWLSLSLWRAGPKEP